MGMCTEAFPKEKGGGWIRRDDVTIAFSRARVRALSGLGLDPEG